MAGPLVVPIAELRRLMALQELYLTASTDEEKVAVDDALRSELDGVPAVTRMLVMVQKEVGERLAAGVGDDAYGAVSVKVAYWAEARVVGLVPPTVFLPKPNVDSALVSIVRRPAPATDAPADRLFELVRAGFGQRRKMLRRSLSGLVGPGAFEAAGVRPDLQLAGRGTALIEAALALVDAAGEESYLETTKPANVAYYERFGYASIREPVPLSPGGPSIFPMLRAARKS